MTAVELNNSVLKDVLRTNLKAYYRFESGALTTDGSGNGKTLTNNNSVASASGVFGGSASLGATNSTNKCFTVNTSPISGSNAPFTLIGWFKFNAVANNALFINTSETATDTFTRFDWYQPTSVLRFYRVRNGIGQDGPTYSFTPTVGTWYHLAMTYDGSKIYGYVNGSVVATGTSTGNGSVNQPFDGLCIGSDPQSETTSTSTLDYDDLAVFNTALTSDQIKELYEGRTVGELWPQNGLVGLWHLNGNSTDYSGNNNHGTDTAITYSAANGKFGQGGSFNGSTSKSIFTSNTQVAPTGNYTLLSWFKTTSGTRVGIYTAMYRTTATGERCGISLAVGNLFVSSSTNKLSHTHGASNATDGTGSKATVCGIRDVNDGKWHFGAVTFDGATIRLYLDGVEEANTACAFNPGYAGTASPGIGFGFKQDSTYQDFFNGSIDEVAIYNRALTPQEIRNYYSWASGRFTKTI